MARLVDSRLKSCQLSFALVLQAVGNTSERANKKITFSSVVGNMKCVIMLINRGLKPFLYARECLHSAFVRPERKRLFALLVIAVCATVRLVSS